MALAIGNNAMTGAYLGANQVRRAYKGGTLVFQAFSPASEQEFIEQTAAGGPAQLLKCFGKTIVNNQLVQNGDFSDGLNGWTIEAGNTASVSGGVITIPYNSIYPDGANARMSQAISLTNGHKMLVLFEIKVTTQAVGKCYPGYFERPTQWFDAPRDYSYYADWKQVAVIIPLTSDKTAAVFGFYKQSGSAISPGDSVSMRGIRLIDLTLRFGAGNEPTSVDEALRLLGGDAFDPTYDPGSLQSNKTAEIRAYDGGTLRGSLALNIPTLTGKLNGEGASVAVFPDGLRGVGTDRDAAYGSTGVVRRQKITGAGFTLHNTSSAGYKTYKAIFNGPTETAFRASQVNTFGIVNYGSFNSGSVAKEIIQYSPSPDGNSYIAIAPNRSIDDFEIDYPLATPLTYTLDTPLPTDLTCVQGDILQRVSDNNCPFVGEMKFGL